MKRFFSIFIASVLTALFTSGLTPAFSADKTAPAPKAETKQAPFTVARMVVAKGMRDKEPVDVTEVIPTSEDKAYCFIEAENITQDTDAAFAWLLGDREMRVITVRLRKGPRWRTYANKTINGQKGDWRVELRDANGAVVKAVKFRVE
ncbi:MAG: DUF2914 domain-containing protein [Deltaproteobacteria bacterium]|nr:DUF2914 domain-containing protein [Deltaproteobacteria bacterium]